MQNSGKGVCLVHCIFEMYFLFDAFCVDVTTPPKIQSTIKKIPVFLSHSIFFSFLQLTFLFLSLSFAYPPPCLFSSANFCHPLSLSSLSFPVSFIISVTLLPNSSLIFPSLSSLIFPHFLSLLIFLFSFLISLTLNFPSLFLNHSPYLSVS